MLRRKDKLDIDIVSLLAVSVNCDNNQDDISFQFQSIRDGAGSPKYQAGAGQSPILFWNFPKSVSTGNIKKCSESFDYSRTFFQNSGSRSRVVNPADQKIDFFSLKYMYEVGGQSIPL